MNYKNNPGNLRTSKTPWRGQKGSHRGFCLFASMTAGFRAMLITLRNYGRFHGIYKLSEIIYRYAPPSENYTETYLEYVMNKTGFARDYSIKTDRDLVTLANAMVRVEQGSKGYYEFCAGLERDGYPLDLWYNSIKF